MENLVKSRAHKSVAAGMEILLWVGQKIQDRKIARNPGCGGEAKCREMLKIGKWWEGRLGGNEDIRRVSDRVGISSTNHKLLHIAPPPPATCTYMYITCICYSVALLHIYLYKEIEEHPSG